MADAYGSDFITVTDEDGTEYELEVLTTIELNGVSYMAVLPADGDINPGDFMILRDEEVDGEPFLTAIDNETELQAVYELIMEQIFEADE